MQHQKSTSPPASKTKTKRKARQVHQRPRFHADAAGIDIGARELMVCVPADRAEQPVRKFTTFTDDLYALADWLGQCGVRTVAMESTGNYWITLHQVLSDRGLEVVLVNARHVRQVPGRKSDVLDCQWLQYLHRVGLLRGSFRPPQEICAVRSLVRFRETLVAQAANQIRALHNAFDQMNVQLHHILDDLSGATGLRILRAIVAGERDPKALAQHRDPRLKADLATVERSLRGDWRAEHLLVLAQALASWDHFQAQIQTVDTEIAARVRALEAKVDLAQAPLPPRTRRATVSSNHPKFDLRGEFYRVLGTDLTAIPTISLLTIQIFLSEVGPDLTRFPSVDHFVSWLAICPGTKISGGKILETRTRHGKPRLARALRQCSLSLLRHQSALGTRYRRLRSRLGAPKALTAMAHLLARIIFTMVKNQTPYDESFLAKAEADHLHRQHQRLHITAQKLGYTLSPISPDLSVIQSTSR